MKVWALGLFGLVAWGLALLPLEPAPRPPALTLILALAVLWSEWHSIRLPGIGLTNCSVAFWLPLALWPRSGQFLAPLALALALGIRTWRLGNPEPKARRLELLVDFIAIGTALAGNRLILSWQPEIPDWQLGLWVSALYCVSLSESQTLLYPELAPPQLQRYQKLQVELLPCRLAACGAGLALSVVGREQPLVSLGLIPALSYLGEALKQKLRLEELGQRRTALKQLEVSQQRLEVASQSQQRLQQNLNRKEEETRIFEAASQALMQVRGGPQTSEQIIRLCHRLVELTTTALFLAEGQGLVLGGTTPRDVPANFRWDKLQEAWESLKGPGPTPAPEGIIPGEDHFLLWTLGPIGLLYVGRSGAAFSEVEIAQLGQAARQARLALQIARHFEALQNSLQQQAALTEEREAWARDLGLLLAESTQFLQHLDRKSMLDRLTQATQVLFPQCKIHIQLRSGESASGASVLTIPIPSPDTSKVGSISVEAPYRNFFSRWHEDLLSLLGAQAAVAWRNLELREQASAAQAQLLQSAKMSAVGQLAAGVAHEMNTPLGSVQLNLDSALRSLPHNPEDARLRLDKAKAMLARTQTIIKNLLYYSRQNDKGRKLCQMSDIVEETLQLIGHPLAIQKIQVNLQLTPTPAIAANAHEIQQILINFLINARDALLEKEAGSRDITVRSYPSPQGGEVCLEVLDRGPGIEPATLEKIFDPFFTTKPLGQGTGLGLSTSLQIAQAHQGRIEVDSRPGVGSRFILILPQALGYTNSNESCPHGPR